MDSVITMISRDEYNHYHDVLRMMVNLGIIKVDTGIIVMTRLRHRLF